MAAFDWLSGRRGSDKRRAGNPVLYPGPRQRNVPLSFPGNEIPDPLPNTKDKLAGFPITAIFPAKQRIPDARAWLEDEAGNDVRLWFSSPTQPANGRFTNLQQNTVCLFAREVLRPGMRYVVRIEANVGPGEWSRSWTFTTQPSAENRRLIYDRTLERINHFRRASGLTPVKLDTEKSVACLAHAGYLARHLDRIKDFRVDQELPRAGRVHGSRSGDCPTFGHSRRRRSRPHDAADWLFSSVLNRHLALNPSMKTVGMGTAQQSPRGWLWVIHLPASRTQGDHDDAILLSGQRSNGCPPLFWS